jgi:hypothetical protein
LLKPFKIAVTLGLQLRDFYSKFVVIQQVPVGVLHKRAQLDDAVVAFSALDHKVPDRLSDDAVRFTHATVRLITVWTPVIFTACTDQVTAGQALEWL